MKNLIDEYWKSIKSYDTEEKLDLYLYRPAGFLIAKLAHALGMNPTQLSILGVIAGLAAAYLYTFPQSTEALIWASLLFVLSGIFDSSDGQLARISGQSTPLGLILDGICDSIVFSSIYFGASMMFIHEYGWGFAVLPVVALLCHSYQCAALDFYNREYIFFGYGRTENDAYWNYNVDEAKAVIRASQNPKTKIFNSLRLSWIAQQHKVSTRTARERIRMRELVMSQDPATRLRFMERYRDHNRLILRFWRLMGPNFHTILMISFIFLRRFDLYLVLIDLVLLNLVLLVLRLAQKKQDDQLLREFGIRGAVPRGLAEVSR